jgi:hypothetical protein
MYHHATGARHQLEQLDMPMGPNGRLEGVEPSLEPKTTPKMHIRECSPVSCCWQHFEIRLQVGCAKSV